MTTAEIVNGFGLTCQLDVEFNIVVDEDPVPGPFLTGQVEMTILKPFDVYGLGVFLGLTSIGKIVKTGEPNNPTGGNSAGGGSSSSGGDGGKKGKTKGAPNFWTVNTSCQYLPWTENFIVLLGKKTPDIQAWLEESVMPISYTSGVQSFPFSFDIRAMETLSNFEYDAPRGQVSVQNKLLLFVATNAGSAGRQVVFPPGRTVTLPYYTRLERACKKPAVNSCCLKKGTEEIAKFTLKLNQQGYLFGDTIEFKLEKKVPQTVKVRDVSVELIRKISVTTPQREVRPVFWRLHECKYPKKFTLERKVLASRTARNNESTWAGCFPFPQGPPDTTGITIEFNYFVELTVNIFGVIQPLKTIVPFKTGAFWDGGHLQKRRPSRLSFPLGSLASFACFQDESDLDNISLSSFPPDYSGLPTRQQSVSSLPPYSEGLLEETEEDLEELDLGPSSSKGRRK